jgi:hypothetical protein
LATRRMPTHAMKPHEWGTQRNGVSGTNGHWEYRIACVPVSPTSSS